MAVNLNNLSPAPWRYSQMSPDDWGFYELARRAFDVMLRRGWWPKQVNWRGRTSWIVCSDEQESEEAERGFAIPNVMARAEVTATQYDWPDPFSALVAADKWYREHVEQANGETNAAT